MFIGSKKKLEDMVEDKIVDHVRYASNSRKEKLLELVEREFELRSKERMLEARIERLEGQLATVTNSMFDKLEDYVASEHFLQDIVNRLKNLQLKE